jgi:hypothetical protein
MSRSSVGARIKNCRDLLVSSRQQQKAMADTFDKQWHELRRHFTIERDAKKLSQIAADVEKRKRMAESAV